MSRKSFITFIVVLILVLLGFGWYFFYGPGGVTQKPVPVTPAKQNVFPFGQGPATPKNNKPQATSTPETVIDLSALNQALPKLREISSEPVAGETAYNASSTAVLRYVEKSTGHVQEINLDTNVENQVSNVTIPQVAETLWGTNGKSLIFRYLKDNATIRSFFGSISSTATGTKPTLEGLFLPDNIKDIAINGDKILYLDPAIEGGRLIQANSDGSKKTAVWSSDFGDWTVSWTNAKSALVYSKPSGGENGVAYIINLGTGTATKIGNDATGLEANMSPAGDYVFISTSVDNGFTSEIYSVTKKTTQPLSISTLASKCVWANTEKGMIYCAIPTNPDSGLYPDDWYKGSVSFIDTLWKINVATGETILVLDPKNETLSDFDMTNLTLDPHDSYLTFINKKDLTLWTYKLK